MFPQSLKEWRRRRFWSQKDLARELGVALATVQRWEAGQNLPFPAQQRRLIEVLKISPDELFSALSEAQESLSKHAA